MSRANGVVAGFVRPDGEAARPTPNPAASGGLSPEVRSRDVMAYLVHDVVAEAMRLGLHDAPPRGAAAARKGLRDG